MRIIPRPIYDRDLDAAQPFAKDALNREPLIKNVTRVFKQSSDGLVVTINAKWGEGKTSFLKLWKISLEKDTSFIPVYYDAFQHDFSSDAFVSISSAIYKGIEKPSYQKNSERERAQLKYLKKASKDVTIELAKMTAGIAVGYLSGGILTNSSVIAWAKSAFQKLTFGALKVNADEQFESYLTSEDSIKTFQDQIKSILAPYEDMPQRKVVMFIDELDRCRPAFAIEVLEKTKHLFNIDSVFFVLAINREQLLKTLERAYGLQSDDASVYLQKFVDFEIRLPGLSDEGAADAHVAENIFRGIATELDLAEGALSLLADTKSLANLSSVCLRLSARAIERSMSLMAVALRSCSETTAAKLKRHIAAASFIRVGAPDYYARLSTHGSFWEGSNSSRDSCLFAWAKTYFLSVDINPKASNVIEITGLKEACDVVDMYEIN